MSKRWERAASSARRGRAAGGSLGAGDAVPTKAKGRPFRDGPSIVLPGMGSSGERDPRGGGLAHEDCHARQVTMRHLTTSFQLLNVLQDVVTRFAMSMAAPRRRLAASRTPKARHRIEVRWPAVMSAGIPVRRMMLMSSRARSLLTMTGRCRRQASSGPHRAGARRRTFAAKQRGSTRWLSPFRPGRPIGCDGRRERPAAG